MIPRRKKHNKVILTPYLGSGAYGDVYGDPAALMGLVESTRQLVRNGKGEEVVSNSSVYLDPIHAPEGSLVTVWPGTPSEYESKVVAVAQWQAGRLSHTVLNLA